MGTHVERFRGNFFLTGVPMKLMPTGAASLLREEIG